MNQVRNGIRHDTLARRLSEMISSGDYKAGTKFPSENELQAQFSVGRHTVREALKILAEQGLIGRRRKTGTVVLSEKPMSSYVHSLRDIRSLVDFSHNTSLNVRSVGFGSSAPSADQEFTELPETRWLRIAGFRSTRAGEPLCWSEIFVPERFADEQPFDSDRAVYATILAKFNLKLDHVEQVIMATGLHARHAETFNLEPGSPALLIKRRYVATGGVTFEISHNLYPAGRYVVHTVMRQRV